MDHQIFVRGGCHRRHQILLGPDALCHLPRAGEAVWIRKQPEVNLVFVFGVLEAQVQGL